MEDWKMKKNIITIIAVLAMLLFLLILGDVLFVRSGIFSEQSSEGTKAMTVALYIAYIAICVYIMVEPVRKLLK